MRRTAKCTWKDYKTNEELKINPVVKQIQNYINKWIQHFRRMDRDRLPHLVMKYQPCGERSQRRHLEKKNFSSVSGTETGHEA